MLAHGRILHIILWVPNWGGQVLVGVLRSFYLFRSVLNWRAFVQLPELLWGNGTAVGISDFFALAETLQRVEETVVT